MIPEEIRNKAKEKLEKEKILAKPITKKEDSKIPELCVHQIGLEMQNDQLRQAQNEFEISRDKYFEFFDSAPLGYFILDEKGYISEVNLTGCRMIGVERSDLIQKPFSTFISKESQEAFYLHLQHTLTSGLKQICEVIIVRKDKDKFEALIESVPVKDVKGKHTLYYTVITEITKRKQDEAELHLQSQILNQVHDAVVSTNLEGFITSWNKGAEKIFGYCADEALGKHISFIHPTENKEFLLNRIIKPLKSKENLELEVLHKRKSGENFWTHLSLSLLKNEKNVPIGMIGFASDINERKLVEGEIFKSRKDLARAQEVGNIGSWRMDIRKDELKWSDENHRIFGIPKGKPMTYETFLSRVHPDDRQYVDNKWKKALTGENYDIEHRIIVEGKIKWVREKAYLEFDKDGELIGGFGITQDITERKHKEEKIENIAKFPSENPYPVLRITRDGTISYSNASGKILLEQWNCQIGAKVPNLWQKRITKVLKTEKYLNELIKCGDTFFSLAIVPVADKGYVNIYGLDITKRKLTEDALNQLNQTLEEKIEERTEELRNSLVELNKTKNYLLQAHRIANLGIWEWDIVNDKIVWSEEIFRIFGIETEKSSDLSFEYFMSFVHPDDVDFVEQTIDDVLNNNKIYDILHRFIRPDGIERIVKQRAEVIRNTAGNPVRMIGTIQDITQEKKKEELLYQQELELKSKAELLDLAHDAIIVHDLDGKIIFWNKGAENSYGFKREEVLGKVSHDILKTKFSEPLLKIISMVSSKGNWNGELIHQTKDKKEIIVDSRWALRKDEQGKPLAVLEIDIDITKRKIAEKEIREAQIYAESIIETIEEAILVLDPTLQVLSVNKSFYKIFKMEEADVLHKYVYELAGGHWRVSELRKLLEDILPNNKPINNYEVEYSNGKSTVHLLLNAKEIFENKQDRRHILLAFHDITSHKLQEKALQDLTEELLLAEEKYRQDVAMALHDSIGQMLAFSKRELETHLKDHNLNKGDRLIRVRELIAKCIKQSRKITSDLSSPTLHTFGLEAGLEELAEEFSRENGLKCSFRTTKYHKPTEKKVELLLYRSAKELLCNISKHAKAQNIEIDIKKSDGFIEITIADDGKGFDVSRLNNNKDKKKTFGLYSIRQRLTNVGGSFNIFSEMKKGTKVVLRAPLKQIEIKKGKNGYQNLISG